MGKALKIGLPLLLLGLAINLGLMISRIKDLDRLDADAARIRAELAVRSAVNLAIYALRTEAEKVAVEGRAAADTLEARLLAGPLIHGPLGVDGAPCAWLEVRSIGLWKRGPQGTFPWDVRMVGSASVPENGDGISQIAHGVAGNQVTANLRFLVEVDADTLKILHQFGLGSELATGKGAQSSIPKLAQLIPMMPTTKAPQIPEARPWGSLDLAIAFAASLLLGLVIRTIDRRWPKGRTAVGPLLRRRQRSFGGKLAGRASDRGLTRLELVFVVLVLTLVGDSLIELARTARNAGEDISVAHRAHALALGILAQVEEIPLEKINRLLDKKGTVTSDGYRIETSVFVFESLDETPNKFTDALTVQVRVLKRDRLLVLLNLVRTDASDR